MRTHSTPLGQPRLWAALVVLMLMLSGCVPVPATLPTKDSIASEEVTPIDGTWRINTINKQVRIEAGRVYAVDPWLHAGLYQIQPGMVVIRDFRRLDTGHYTGADLPLQGTFDGQLRPHGRIEVTVQTAIGPMRYELAPVDLDDAEAYKTELAGTDYPVIEPAPEPTPIITPPPQPAPIVRPGNDVTPGCGGFGEHPCSKIKPVDRGKAGKLLCPGGQNFLSKGKCWVCPNGYTRSLKPLDHPKACHERGHPFKGPFTSARYNGQPNGCPDGQFNHLGRCKSCPDGFKRDGIGAASTNMCKPVKGNFGCDAGYRQAKQPPKVKNMLASLFGLKSGKYCAPPFDIKAAARAAMPSGGQLKEAAEVFLKGMTGNKEKMRAFRSAFVKKDWGALLDMLVQQPGFMRAIEVGKKLGYEEVSVGVGGDVSIIGGLNAEVGLAINTRNGKIRPYAAGGLSKGVSIGVDGTASLGFWKVPFETGATQGITTSVSGVISLGGGAWYTYFDPRKKAQEELAGFTFSAGVGLGAEFGEYNEVGTKVFGALPMRMPGV